MGRFRIYPSKMTTIMEQDPLVNTGLNEVAELWHGVDGIARILVKFDIDDYMNLWDDGLIPTLSAATSTLKFFDCATYQTGATSFDVEVCAQTQEWDGGIGYDHIGLNTQDGFANWYSATSSTAWVDSESGVTISGGDISIIVGSQHFDGLGEDLDLDISTDISYLWDQFTGINYGIMLRFSDSDEMLNDCSKRVKKFYSLHTNDYELPFLQLDWDSRISEDGNNMIVGKPQYLYLLTQFNGKMQNVYSAISMTISGKSSESVDEYTSSMIENPEAGVYRVAISPVVSEEFNDEWRVWLTDSQDEVVTIKSFTASSLDLSWNLSSIAFGTSSQYTISLPTLKPSYTHGEKIYLPIFARKNFTSTYECLKSMEYRICLVDGETDFVMEDWGYTSYMTDQNFILLNTIWYLPGYTYRIDFRYYDAASLQYIESNRTFEVED